MLLLQRRLAHLDGNQLGIGLHFGCAFLKLGSHVFLCKINVVALKNGIARMWNGQRYSNRNKRPSAS